MIEWAINGVSKLALELDGSSYVRAANLSDLLDDLRINHSQEWFRVFCDRLYYTINQYPQEDWHIALSEFQLFSKYRGQLLLDQYCDANSTVCYQGSWLGLGPLMLLARNESSSIDAFDIDGNANIVSEYLCGEWNYVAENTDVLQLSYDYKIYVNLITEHLDDISEWRNTLPKDSIVLASNTDITDTDHYSCCESLEDFLYQLGVLVPLATDVVTCYRADGSAMNRWIVLFST